MSTQVATTEPTTLLEAVFGRGVNNIPAVVRFRAWPVELRAALAAVLLASSILLPYLGAVGLWDPWETHYGEVAREMVQRNDYVHPYWENAWFFSKPAFTMWMQAAGLQIADAGPMFALVVGVLLLSVGAWLFRRGSVRWSSLKLGPVLPSLSAAPRTGYSKLMSGVPTRIGVVTVLAILLRLLRLARVMSFSESDVGLMAKWLFAALLVVGAVFVVRGIGNSYSQKGEVELPPESSDAAMEFWGVLGITSGFFALALFVWAKTIVLPWSFSTVSAGPAALPLFTEWGFRLPFTLFSILAVGLLTYALTIAVNARAALATAVVLVTMPLYFLLSRQAVTDTPIVSATIAGIACAMVGLFDTKSKYRSEWWYGSYVLFGIATLAKGLLGFGVPMVVFILYVMLRHLTWKSVSEHFVWAYKHLSNAAGAGLAAGAVAALVASTLGKRWGTTFMAVPVIDNQSLISASTWLGIMWGSLVFWAVTTVMLGQGKQSFPEKPPPVIAMAYEMRLGTGLLLFLAVCLPWYYEMFTFWRVDDESKIFWFRFIIHDHFARLGSGVHTTTPGGDFTYFILQGGYAMFPWVVIIPGAIATAARLKIRGPLTSDGVGLIAVLWFVVSWALIGSSATKFHHYVFPMLPPMAILMGMFIDKLWEEGLDGQGLVLLFGVPLFILVGKDLAATPKNFTDLFVYNYDRPYPAFLTEDPIFRGNNTKQLMGMAMALAGMLVGLFALMRSRSLVFITGLAAALTWGVWFNWFHWVDLSHHWTQRDQFWRYYTQRKGDEPIAAFLMNWRGETFYSRNTVKQIKDNPQVGMKTYAEQPGREWSLVEHARLGILKGAVGDRNVTLVDKDLNNKFVLVTID